MIKTYNLSETLLNVIEENKVDQLIIAYQLGFTRTKPNYRTQIAKGLGVSVLTLGVYTPLPIKSSSKIFAWTIDTKTKKIIFHNKNLLYVEPLNSKEISNQICDVFEGFYTYKSQNGTCFHY
jgi:tRNA U34 2-thiouridine synthase MnmA/TrmU